MADRLKVFVFIDNFLPLTETFIYDHAIRLSKNHDVQVSCIKQLNVERFPFDRLQKLDYPDSKVRKIIRSRLYRHNITLNYTNAVFKHELNQLVRAHQPDVIHCHFGNKAVRLLDNLDADSYHGPIFITFYGYDASVLLKQRPAYRRRIRKILQRAEVYPIMVSEFLLKNLQTFDVVSSRSKVIHLGTNTDFFKPKPKKKNKIFTFLQIAGFRAKKGHIYTLEAFASFLKTYPNFPCKLIFGGSGDLEAPMKLKAKQLGISTQVEFKGWVDRIEAKNLLDQADAFLHFSIIPVSADTEGLPVAIIEAMAMELPIGATYHSGIPELVEHGVNGLLTQERDIDGYVSVMKGLTAWGRQAQNRDKVIANFSHQSYIDKDLVTSYQTAIADFKR